MAAEKTKPTRSCWSCRAFKALFKDSTPCYHCWGYSYWRPQSAKQKRLIRINAEMEEWRKNKKKENLNASEVEVEAGIREAVINKSE